MHQAKIDDSYFIILAEQENIFIAPPHILSKVALRFFYVLGKLMALRFVDVDPRELFLDLLPRKQAARVLPQRPCRLRHAEDESAFERPRGRSAFPDQVLDQRLVALLVFKALLG